MVHEMASPGGAGLRADDVDERDGLCLAVLDQHAAELGASGGVHLVVVGGGGGEGGGGGRPTRRGKGYAGATKPRDASELSLLRPRAPTRSVDGPPWVRPTAYDPSVALGAHGVHLRIPGEKGVSRPSQ
jgi:hypothetical protein